jgi:hypothetical protein
MSAQLTRLSCAIALVIIAPFVLASCAVPTQKELGLSAIQLESPAPTSSNDDLNEPGLANQVSDSFAELEIEDQTGTGQSVEIDEVRLSIGLGFLVITNREGNVLGYATVTPDSQPVSASLTSKVTSSQELIGLLFLDNGDGEFSSQQDSEILDDEGEPVEEDFEYTYRQN